MSEADVKARLSKLFKLDEPRTAGPGQQMPGELFRGVGWIVTGEGGVLTLHYISGELAGREKELTISRPEADALHSGALDLNTLLIRHDAG